MIVGEKCLGLSERLSDGGGKTLLFEKIVPIHGKREKNVKKSQSLCFHDLFILLKFFTDKICVSFPVLNSEGVG